MTEFFSDQQEINSVPVEINEKPRKKSTEQKKTPKYSNKNHTKLLKLYTSDTFRTNLLQNNDEQLHNRYITFPRPSY